MKRFPRCIMATCVVPWNEQGIFVEDLFRYQIQQLLAHGTKHLYIFGTAGEGYAVSERQFDQIAQVFVETMREGAAEPMIGLINLSLATIQERIERARAMGVRQFQFSLPSWGALSEREVFEFFRQTCGRFRDCQFLHYNLLRTKRLITPREYVRLADEHPNLVATKNSTDSIDRLEELLSLTPQLQHFFTEAGFAYGSLLDECGLLISLASIHWDSAHQFFEAGRSRDTELLLQGQREMLALGRDLGDLVAGTAHMDGAFDKMLWKLHDSRFPLRLLPPYEGVSDACFEQFRTLIHEKYPRWTLSSN